MEGDQLELFAWEHPWRGRAELASWREVPRAPGTYRFLGADGRVLYVGVSVDLARRLASWRHLRPGRAGPRQLRLLARTARVTWQESASRVDARLAEARLIRELRPPFNREYTHPESVVHVALEPRRDHVLLRWGRDAPALAAAAPRVHGAFRGPSGRRAVLAFARLAWWHARGAGACWAELPVELGRERPPPELRVALPGTDPGRHARLVDAFWAGESSSWLHRVAGSGGERLARAEDRWLRSLLELDRVHLAGFFDHGATRARILRGGSRDPVSGDALDDALARERLLPGESRL